MTPSSTTGSAWRRALRGAGSKRREPSWPLLWDIGRRRSRCHGSTPPPLDLIPTARPLLPPEATALSPKVGLGKGYTESDEGFSSFLGPQDPTAEAHLVPSPGEARLLIRTTAMVPGSHW